ncbi:GDSL-type esterase/lipase family protein [Massilia phosphatilytica]
MIRHRPLAALTLALAFQSQPALAGGHWLTSWYAAPQPAWDSSFTLPMNVPARLDDATLRETVRLSAGGQRIRLVFSNRYGREPVQLGAVRVGPADDGPGSRTLTFSGQPGVAIAPGATVTSDPVALPVRPLARLAVTTRLPAPTPIASFHWGAQQTMQVTMGSDTTRFGGRLFLDHAIAMVEAAIPGRTVVALGDSITDGNGSTPDADRRWPDLLAERLARHGIAVANAGISGGRLARNGMGQSALARFGRDVLGQPGVTDVIVLLGINDIGWPGSPFAPGEHAATLGQARVQATGRRGPRARRARDGGRATAAVRRRPRWHAVRRPLQS